MMRLPSPVRPAATALTVIAVCSVLVAGLAVADPDQPPAPGAVDPAPSEWSPHADFWPYNTFTDHVTPEMISGMSDACHWFGTQFDPLMAQIHDFNRMLADQHDAYPGVQAQANAVVASIDRATGFLGPRVQPLTIRNTPDNYGPYSPIYGGKEVTELLFQLSRIAEVIRKKQPAGFARPHLDAAHGWADALRNSGACT